ISKTRKAQNLYEFSLKGRTLLQWRIRYNTSIQWQATLDACNELSIQVVKRRYFIRWTQYIADISTEHRKMAIADLYRRCKLKRFAMKAMISM
uniref:Uncharacterized protein n=1 Tax=Ciona savignyi TaxID=51511 RepID=H2ZA42_CIOSA